MGSSMLLMVGGRLGSEVVADCLVEAGRVQHRHLRDQWLLKRLRIFWRVV